MKTVLFLFLLTFVSEASYGGIHSSEPVVKSELVVKVEQSGNLVKVICKNALSSCPVKISILTEFGKPIFSEAIKEKNNFTRVYNVSKLSEGTYWVTIISKKSETIEKIKCSTP